MNDDQESLHAHHQPYLRLQPGDGAKVRFMEGNSPMVPIHEWNKPTELQKAYQLVRADKCAKEGHPVVDNRGTVTGGGWVTNMTGTKYAGPDPVERGNLQCKCGKFSWIPSHS